MDPSQKSGYTPSYRHAKRPYPGTDMAVIQEKRQIFSYYWTCLAF